MVDSEALKPEVKVLIGIPTAESTKRADFYDYLDQMDKPLGTVISRAHGQSPARNRNLMIDMAINHNCTHIMFIDDDVLVSKDALMKLLSHDKDIACGLYLMRAFPHQPVAFDHQNSEGMVRWLQLTPSLNGLIEVESTGLGCVLINLNVFKSLEKPYIRLGEVEKDHWCDDLGFYKRAKEAGYVIWLDLDIRCGHVVASVIRPENVSGTWFTSYDTNGSGRVTVAQGYIQKENVDA